MATRRPLSLVSGRVQELPAGDNLTGLVVGTDVQAWKAVLDATTAAFTTALNSKLAGIETGATADQTASEILSALLTVDGAGSLLDADLLDGNHASAFSLVGHNHSGVYQPLDADLTALAAANNSAVLAATTASFLLADETKLDGIETGATADQTAAEILAALLTVDGAGSLLDADLLDGNHASAFSLVGHNHSGVYQPLDGTLTAFAALTIAANTLTIGTGADAFSQTAFAANTFPARASTGSLVAKPISDFGLSLVDDADQATARSTLGLGTLATQNGTFSGTHSGTSSGTNTGDNPGVTSVGGTAPIVSSGGTTPTISISAATPSAAGSMSAADKTKLDGLSAASVLSGYIYGLEMSNNSTDPTNDIDIATGIASASGAEAYLALTSALTKRLDASWVVGTGNGGLDTGTVANVTYHVFLIRRSDTGVVDVLFSTSPTSPTMPTNYDQKRRIGSILRETGANVPFYQRGDEFYRQTPKSDYNAAPGTTAAVLRTVGVPTGIKVQVIGQVGMIITTSGSGVYITDPDGTDTTADSTAGRVHLVCAGVSSNNIGATYRAWTNTSAQVRTRLEAVAGTVTLRLGTFGWVDHRGGTVSQATAPAATNITLGSAQATTSGTSKDWTIPSGAKRVTLSLVGVSLTGTDNLLIQLGTSGGIETTGYVGVTATQNSGGANYSVLSTGFAVLVAGSGAAISGKAVIDLVDGNTWSAEGKFGNPGDISVKTVAGHKTLGGELTTLRLTSSGSNTFDLGSANVSWEF